jgi:cytochrome c peroxidase
MNRFQITIGCGLGLAALAVLAGWTIVGFAQDQKLEPPTDSLPSDWDWSSPPLGISGLPAEPSDNPLTESKVRLGRRLFFDTILSDDGSMSCATCHRPEHGFASPQVVSIGVNNARGERNVPTLWNRAYGRHFFWDGRANTLEQQALQPIENPKELASSVPAVIARLAADASYQEAFRQAFAGADDGFVESDLTRLITAENLAKAIASFERTLVVGNGPADQFRASEYGALTAQQRIGMWIFESRGKCWQCHSGDHLTDDHFHNTGVGYGREPRDVGRFGVTTRESDRFAMKTPSLRGISHSGPYMHDGSLATLRDVVSFYNQGGSPNDPGLDPLIRPLELNDAEVDALAEFLRALTPDELFAR